MRELPKIALLGLSHGLSDCAAGFMIGGLPAVQGAGSLDIGALILLYNVLAFGGQVPAGMVLDRWGRPKLALMLSLGLVATALCTFAWAPVVAIALAGVGGAFFHVAGGMLALQADPRSTVGAGIFAAPGVMGLALGGYMAWQGLPAHWLLAAACIAVAALAWRVPFTTDRPTTQSAAHAESLEWHDVLMLVLLLSIGMRSAVWNLFELIHGGEHGLLLAMGLGAMLGKLAGGWGAAAIGWRRYAIAALLVSTPLLSWGGNHWYTLLPGIFLLQSATPAAVLGMYRLLPRMPATAIGMCFGLAIAAGGIPTLLGWRPSLWVLAVILPLVAIGYAWGMRQPRQPVRNEGAAQT